LPFSCVLRLRRPQSSHNSDQIRRFFFHRECWQGLCRRSSRNFARRIKFAAVTRAFEDVLVGVPFLPAPEMRASIVKGGDFAVDVFNKPDSSFGHVPGRS
jgi:hypothetical protein